MFPVAIRLKMHLKSPLLEKRSAFARAGTTSIHKTSEDSASMIQCDELLKVFACW